MLEKLSESLKSIFQKISRALIVDDKLVNDLTRSLQMALIQADVNIKLALQLTEKIKSRALKEKPPATLSTKEHLINILYEELVNLIGERGELALKKGNNKIMLLGLFGSGKTTTCGKLAQRYLNQGYKVALLALDTHRPAAIEQLEQVGKQVKVDVLSTKEIKDPIEIYNSFKAKIKKYDVVIIDTAGRGEATKELIAELKKLYQEIKPDFAMLVLSADIGQAAEKQIKAFSSVCPIDGVILTRMDGTARGGGALTACSLTGAKIIFLGVGEKLEDLEIFNPKGFVSRLLGLGDLEALLAKAKEAISHDEAEEIENKILRGELNLIDLYKQMETLAKMGPIQKILELIPGFSQLALPKEVLQVSEEKLKKWRFAMQSMTRQELENPEIIDLKRTERIAKGSGIPANEIRELIKQYNLAKKVVKMLKTVKSPEKLLEKFKGFGGKTPILKF